MRRAVGILALAGLLLLLAASEAAAHARLVGTDPAADAVLPTRPAVARLQFDEPVQPVAAGVQLHRADLPPQPLPARSVGETVELTLPEDLGQGTFLISWKVRSADSHPISGVLEFSVGHRGPPPTGPRPSGADVAEPFRVAAQTLGYLGLLAATGLALVDVLAAGVPGVAALRERSARRRRRWEAVGTGLALSGSVGLTVLAGLTGASIVDALLALLLVALGLSLLLAAPDRTGRHGRLMVGCGSLVAAASVLPVGHTRTEQPAWLMLPADLLHVLTGGIWFGGLLGLVLLLGAALGRRGPGGTFDTGPAAVLLGRFSLLAGVAVVLLALTGTVQAVLILPAPAALADTGYGRVLLVKLGLTAVAAGIAAVNHFRVVPRVLAARSGSAATRRLRRAVLNEAAIIALAVVTAGVLVGLSPNVAEPPAVPREFTAQLASATVRGRVNPGRVGGNAMEWTIVDASGRTVPVVATPRVRAFHEPSGTGPLVGDTQWVPLGATTRGPGGTTAHRAGSYRTSLDLPLAGTWRIEIAARLSTYDEPVTEIRVEIT